MALLSQVILKDVIANIPAAGVAGRLFFATDTNVAMRDNGSSWDVVTPAPLINVMSAEGDLIVGGAAGALTRLPAGTSGQVLTSGGAGAEPSWQAGAGGMANPMTAEGDIIIGGASGAPARLPAGSAGQVLTSAGPGAEPTWQAASGGGDSSSVPSGLVLLEQHTASGGTELDFTTALSSDYDDYLIEIVDLQVGTNGTCPILQFSTTEGTSWDTSSLYSWRQTNTDLQSGSSGTNNQSGVDGLVIFGGSDRSGLAAAAAHPMRASIRLTNPLSATANKSIRMEGIACYQNGDPYGFQAWGLYSNNAGVNAFRICVESGTLASGTVRVYGLSNTATTGSGSSGGSITEAITNVALTSSAPGNFTVAHGMSSAPRAVTIQMTAMGQIVFQTPMFDATNLYLTASDTGVTATAACFA
jgi:hypothetical protein